MTTEEGLAELPPSDPHHVAASVFINRRTRRLRKEGYYAAHGEIIGRQITLDDFLQPRPCPMCNRIMSVREAEQGACDDCYFGDGWR